MRDHSRHIGRDGVAGTGDSAVCEQFLTALFDEAPTGTHIELRSRTAAGMSRAFFPVHDIVGVAAEIVRRGHETDVYVGVLPRARQASRRSDLAPVGSVLWCDCDTPQSVAALAAFAPVPSVVMASGTGANRHAYWLLDEAIPIDTLEAANRHLAVVLGADVCCADPTRVLRPPQSRNFKGSPPAEVRLLRCDGDARYRLADMVPDLDLEALPSRAHLSRRVGSDPLLSIYPALYVERLTGTRVPRNRKVSCPFHEDHTPSLHVYRDPARGWYCYGCGRGGTVYDFAAHFLGVEPRGSAFVELRDRLTALLLP